MLFARQVSALFYKNAILARRCIKMHLLMLLLLPLMFCLVPVIKEALRDESVGLETWTDLSRSSSMSSFARFAIVDLRPPGDLLDADSCASKFIDELSSALATDDTETEIHFSDQRFDDLYMENCRENTSKYSGAFILKGFGTDNQNHAKYDIVIQANDDTTETYMLGKIGASLMRVFRQGGALEHSKMQLSNSAGYSDLFAPNPIITGITSCTFLSLSLFLQLMLSEKDERVFLLMRISGLHISGYFLCQFLWFAVLSIFPLTIQAASLLMLKDFSLASGQGAALLIALSLICLSNASLAILLSTLCKRAALAVPMVFTVAGFIPMFIAFSSLFILPPQVNLLPIFGYSKLLLSLAGMNMPFLDIVRVPEVWMGLLGLCVHFFLYSLVSVYTANVVDQNKSGLSRPWHFVISDRFSKKPKLKPTDPDTLGPEPASQLLLDSDVAQECSKVKSQSIRDLCMNKLLVFDQVSKQYKGGKLAVDRTCFALGRDMVFGLLGPNGAGKSTLILMAAGLIQPSDGDVYIDGCSPSSNPDQYYTKVGYCHQHDIYWKDLTVMEHLVFFEKLRASSKDAEIALRVKNKLSQVRLLPFANSRASGLSGGERRRVSIAIALDSDVVFLDEPSTGLDPKVRRIIWEIIAECKQDRLIIITTHSMEEAEILCDQITIMAHGQMRCFGSPDYLKQKFGGQIFVNLTVLKGVSIPEVIKGIQALVLGQVSLSVLYESADGTSAKLLFGGNKTQLLDLMLPLLESKARLKIDSFGVNQSSLDDVFLNIVKEADADA